MKQKLLVPFAGLLVASFMLMPSIGMAQSTTTTAQISSITALIQQIQALQSQLKALQAQTSTEFNAFLTTLSLGSEGDAVLALQALLAANPNIYPEGLITGHFGKATERALKRLQKENGLEQVGVVGPRTRALLNRLLKDNQISLEDDDEDEDNDGDRNEHRLCARIAAGHMIAPGWLRKHNGQRPIVPECQTLPRGIVDRLDDDDDDHDDNTGTTTPDVVAPTVRDLAANSTSSTTASVIWRTNEKATSTLWYATTTPISTSTATKLENSTWKTYHVYDLIGLSASTTYYYLTKVSDMVGNTALTTEHSFVTGN